MRSRTVAGALVHCVKIGKIRKWRGRPCVRYVDCIKKAVLVVCESGPVLWWCGARVAVFLEKAERFCRHFFVLLIGATRIGGDPSGGIVYLN